MLKKNPTESTGTGSGVGTSITEMIRDDYEDATIVNAAIFPYVSLIRHITPEQSTLSNTHRYDSGEVIVQNYNAILTLSELTQLSDGVILFDNTRIHELCSKLLKIERPSFKDLNFAIASQLGSTLFPSKTSSRGGLCGIPEQCPHPGYRLLTVRSIPQVPERSKAFTVCGVGAWCLRAKRENSQISSLFQLFQLYRSNYRNVTRITHS